jgi:hypothetical protein
VLAGPRIHDDFVAALTEQARGTRTGGPEDPDVLYGPLNNANQLSRVSGFIGRLPQDASVQTGGERVGARGYFYAPTVIDGLQQHDEIIQDEVFGPVITVQRSRRHLHTARDRLAELLQRLQHLRLATVEPDPGVVGQSLGQRRCPGGAVDVGEDRTRRDRDRARARIDGGVRGGPVLVLRPGSHLTPRCPAHRVARHRHRHRVGQRLPDGDPPVRSREVNLLGIVGHATFCVVVVYNNLLARLRRLGGNFAEASADLGALPWQTFRYVTFPMIRSALFAGALLAFALSFHEIIVTTFTAGPGIQTLPIWIFSNLFRPNQAPVVNVVAAVLIVLSIVPIYIAQRLSANSAAGGRL